MKLLTNPVAWKQWIKDEEGFFTTVNLPVFEKASWIK